MGQPLLAEGKTKKILGGVEDGHVLIVSKDRITALNGVKSHNIQGKASISTRTTCNVFKILNHAGIPTAFAKEMDEITFLAKHCHMIPIEWVTRRLATGSFLKRNPGVTEGHKFTPLLMETFYKDDANDDPQWSEEQILAGKFQGNGRVIEEAEIQIMKKMCGTVFEILEKHWASQNCVLVDIKVEFGIDKQGNILLADVIDNDSWRLWPSGDKKLMKDKQVYRNLSEVKDSDLITIKENFQWVADQTDVIVNGLNQSDSLVVILMGSESDKELGKSLKECCEKYGLNGEMRISSVHKSPQRVLQIISQYEGNDKKVVFIAVAGRSNGLGPALAGSTIFPVINCPPARQELSRDIWSSLHTPSGIGCATVVYPEAAVLMAANIHAMRDDALWCKLRTNQMHNYIKLIVADKNLNIE